MWLRFFRIKDASSGLSFAKNGTLRNKISSSTQCPARDSYIDRGGKILCYFNKGVKVCGVLI